MLSCDVQAVAALLSILEKDPDLQAGMLDNLRVKVGGHERCTTATGC
jgi:hypothetical protein